MSLAVVLRATLIADDAVLALVSTRVYWVKLPQRPTYPAVTLELISGDPNNAVDKLSALKWARVRINVWHTKHEGAYDTAQVIETALNGKKFTKLRSIVAGGLRDFFEPAVDAYYLTQDFSIWYYE